MRTDHDQDLSREEREALASLLQVNLYSSEQEDNIVQTLIEKGLVKKKRHRQLVKCVWIASAAALLLLTFTLGVQYGKYQNQNQQSSREPNESIKAVEQPRLPREHHEPFQNIARTQLTIEEYRDEPDRPGNIYGLHTKHLR